jgi:hypothetical protein
MYLFYTVRLKNRFMSWLEMLAYSTRRENMYFAVVNRAWTTRLKLLLYFKLFFEYIQYSPLINIPL